MFKTVHITLINSVTFFNLFFSLYFKAHSWKAESALMGHKNIDLGALSFHVSQTHIYMLEHLTANWVQYHKYVEQSELWAALSFGGVVVGPFALLGCEWDKN